MAELVDEPLTPLRLLHDALLVVLSDGARQLVVVHGGPVLALPPESRHAHGVLYFKYSVTCDNTCFELNIMHIKQSIVNENSFDTGFRVI